MQRMKEMQQQMSQLHQHNEHLQKENKMNKKKKKMGIVKPLECNKGIAATAGQIAKQEVFHRLKFVKNQEQLDDLSTNTTIGNRVMDAMRVRMDDKRRWWETYKDKVYASFNAQRSCCTTYVKRAFFSECQKCFFWVF